jgi:biopolymer transport protein ExbD
MKSLLSVCLLSIMLAIADGPAFAQSGTGSSYADQTMQRGVNVSLAATNNAESMPAADDQGAWIVTVTADGSLYFGTHSLTPASLKEWMISHPRKRDQKLYIKADVRARYASVDKALEAGRSAALTEAVLLTSQERRAEPGSRVPPEGLEVLIAEITNSDPKPTVVYILNGGGDSLGLRINKQNVPWNDLQSTLDGIFGNRSGRMAVVKADEGVPFAHVVRVIDICRSAGAKVALVAP